MLLLTQGIPRFVSMEMPARLLHEPRTRHVMARKLFHKGLASCREGISQHVENLKVGIAGMRTDRRMLRMLVASDKISTAGPGCGV
jgi:hypothetical protein